VENRRVLCAVGRHGCVAVGARWWQCTMPQRHGRPELPLPLLPLLLLLLLLLLHYECDDQAVSSKYQLLLLDGSSSW
jgi:hypothetical protein